MASLLHSTKEKILKHRKSKSSGLDHNEHEQNGTSHSTSPAQTHAGESLLMTQAIPAWHVHGSSPIILPDSTPPGNLPKAGQTSTDPDSIADHIHPLTDGSQALSNATGTQSVPERSSSLRLKGRRESRQRRKSEQRPDLDRIDSESIPDGISKVPTCPNQDMDHQLPRKPLPVPKDDENVQNKIQNLSLQQSEVSNSVQGNTWHAASGLTNSVHNAFTDRKDPHGQDGTHTQTSVIAQKHEHLTLPEGFQIQDSSHTIVDEVIRPAVTQEVIRHNVKEVQQEVITRDIHVHHFYTYAQPIKVTEILPAKHYVIDGVTGLKTEIPAPQGWQMPHGLEPRIPDISHIKISTRHYLVNEEFPNGTPEPPPRGQLPDRITGRMVDASHI